MFNHLITNDVLCDNVFVMIYLITNIVLIQRLQRIQYKQSFSPQNVIFTS